MGTGLVAEEVTEDNNSGGATVEDRAGAGSSEASKFKDV